MEGAKFIVPDQASMKRRESKILSLLFKANVPICVAVRTVNNQCDAFAANQALLAVGPIAGQSYMRASLEAEM